MRDLQPTRKISAGNNTLALPLRKVDLGQFTFEANGKRMNAGEYIDRQRVGGLLVIKDGNIVYERYGLGNNEDTLWVSFSVAKSIHIDPARNVVIALHSVRASASKESEWRCRMR